MSEYLHTAFLVLFALGLGTGIVCISSLLGRNKGPKTCLEPYECGVDAAARPRRPVHIRFFIVALVFLVFDVEVALLFPWGLLVRRFAGGEMARFILIEGLVFIAILAAALIYVVRRGLFKWGENAKLPS
jgi:NADH-quinone oxidoreductase subunit A